LKQSGESGGHAVRIKDLGVTVLDRWSAAFRDVLAATIAAALAWIIAQVTFGHPYPVFAAIVALICLAPGLPSQAKQAMGLLVGVYIGIIVGEIALHLPAGPSVVRGTISIFIAMMLASSFGLGPVVPIQAGVSTVLIFVLGPATAGYVRMIDSTIGIAVALLFSQFLITPDPVGMVENAARRLLQQLASGFALCVTALERTDLKAAKSAVERFSASHNNLDGLDASIAWARHSVRWSLRGRLAADAVNDVVGRYDRRAIRLYASALLFGEALANALRMGGAPPTGLRERVRKVASLCAELAAEKPLTDIPRRQPVCEDSISPLWRTCLDHLLTVEAALLAFATIKDGADNKPPQ
jgi:uncharacterized membrane protein YgaE (UPF0421/DUF939 family)